MYCHARPRQEPVESVSLGVVCFKNRRTATKTGNVDLSIEHAVAMTKAKGNACSVFVRPGGQGSSCHAAMHAQVQMCDIALSVDPTAPKASGWRYALLGRCIACQVGSPLRLTPCQCRM